MILVPLVLTARLVNANVWSYMVFGSLYANWLTLIHSEHAHPWDRLFRMIGTYILKIHHHKKDEIPHAFLYFVLSSLLCSLFPTFFSWSFRMIGTYRSTDHFTVFSFYCSSPSFFFVSSFFISFLFPDFVILHFCS